MTLFPFFKQRQPRHFEHQPIYYDKAADERRQRYERIQKELDMEKNQTDGNKTQVHDFEKEMRGSFRENTPGGSRIDKLVKTNRTVMIVFIILLLIVVALYLKIA